ncbi:MAG: ABC transporter permease, partial [Clostridia bacterium]|nr:ABC transporter permease [Clostridia bacterium]
MKNILSIMKKEFSRFFKDKRMVLTTLVLPGLMIYLLYSMMGSGMLSSFEPEKDHIYKVYMYNESQTLKPIMDKITETFEEMEDVTFKVEYTKDSTEVLVEDAFDLLEEQKIDLVIVYPPRFDIEVSSAGGLGENVISIYYNSTNKYSSNAYNYFATFYDLIEEQVYGSHYDINLGEDKYDVATEEEVSAQMFSMLLPMLLIVFLFSGCISIAPESIAGEKERGTIATLLVTPVNRRDLAIGKILSLSTISLLSGISSFLGTMLSLPKMMGGELNVSANFYSVSDYLWLLAIIISTVLLFTAVIGIISAYSKSVKEATSLMTPILILVTLLGMTSMFTQSGQSNVLFYLIPAYNCIQAMTGIFAFKVSVVNIVVTIVSNLVY